MAQNVLFRTARFFQGVGKNRQAVEGSVLIDALGDLPYRAVVPRQPSGIKGDGAEGIAEDVTKDVCLLPSFLHLSRRAD
jgi:hypothetical protein